MTLKEFIGWCVAIGAAGAAITYIIKLYLWIRRGGQSIAKKWDRVDDGVTAMLTEMERVKLELARVKGEVEFNGGNSMKDAVTDLATEQAIANTVRRLSSTKATLSWKVTKDGSLIAKEVSPYFTDLTGLAREDCDRSGWSNMISAAERDTVVRHRRECMLAGEVFLTEYTVVNIHSGMQTRVRHRSEPVPNSKGNIVGWVSEITPIEQ